MAVLLTLFLIFIEESNGMIKIIYSLSSKFFEGFPSDIVSKTQNEGVYHIKMTS